MIEYGKLDRLIKQAVEELETRDKKRKDFIDEKKYLELIDFLIDNELDNNHYQEPQLWTNEIDMMFDFLYSNAQALEVFNDDWDGELLIKYEDKYISLYEIHGQDCYRRIASAIRSHPVNCVNFDDIVKFVEEGVKPIRTQVLQVANMALNSLEVISSQLNLSIDIYEIKEYLINNLK